MLIAVLVAMIGLLGTVAVQQAGMNAAVNVNDAQVAMRLGTMMLEQFNTRRTQVAPFMDLLGPVAGTRLERPGLPGCAGPPERGPLGQQPVASPDAGDQHRL